MMLVTLYIAVDEGRVLAITADRDQALEALDKGSGQSRIYLVDAIDVVAMQSAGLPEGHSAEGSDRVGDGAPEGDGGHPILRSPEDGNDR